MDYQLLILFGWQPSERWISLTQRALEKLTCYRMIFNIPLWSVAFMPHCQTI